MTFNLNEFFYNIIPGAIFLIFWNLMNTEILEPIISKLKNLFTDPTVFGIIFLIFALTLGLILHGIWRTAKFYCNKRNKNDKQNEYLRDAYLWAKDMRKLPEYFSSRSAVWGCFIVGLVISLFIVPRFYLYYLFLIVLFGFMYKADNEKTTNSIKNTHEAIIKWK